MNVIQLVGNTPLQRLGRLCDKPGVRLLAKLEGHNPGGSVKDRAAVWMIRGAEERGLLKNGTILLEPTSGNTGIALAMVAAVMGHPIKLVLPGNATAERVDTMRAYGAEVVLTDPEGLMEGARDHADALNAQGGYLLLNQFANSDNPLAHYESTGPEVWRDTAGKITHFVSSMGTTGTIMGVSRYLKEKNPEVEIVGVQPQDGTVIPGIRRWSPEYLPEIYDESRVDRIIDVEQEESARTTRALARQEGLFCGLSGGGAVCAALKLAEELENGTIVTIIPDRGDRYLSSDLFVSGPHAGDPHGKTSEDDAERD